MVSVSIFFAVGFDLTASFCCGDTFVPETKNRRLNRIPGEYQQIAMGFFKAEG